MDTCEIHEKNRGRVETRAAFSTCDIGWLPQREDWKDMACIGAIHTRVSSKKGDSDEWHYYISSRPLSAEELLTRARLEWSVETMHWLLDVHFGEDFCRVEDKHSAKSEYGEKNRTKCDKTVQNGSWRQATYIKIYVELLAGMQ
jgi:hypothetical protein